MIGHLLTVTVVSGHQGLASRVKQRVFYSAQAQVQSLHGFDRSIEYASMAHHIAVRVVTNDQVVFARGNCLHQFVGQLGRAHLWLEIIGCNIR